MHCLWFVDLSLIVFWFVSLYFSLASAGRGWFLWFYIRMAFKSMLVPKCCERVPAVEFYNQIWIRYLCGSIWRRNFLEESCYFYCLQCSFAIAAYNYVVYGSVLDFMYRNICILTSWLLSGLIDDIKWFFLGTWIHFNCNCNCSAVWKYGYSWLLP